jgi:MacB-like periplasmic core domain
VAQRFFAVYAMPALAGRAFTDDEEQPNGPGAAVIAERFWTRRFHRDPSTVERALVIGGSYEIVGVMPHTFTSAATDVWLPAQIAPAGVPKAQGRLAVRARRPEHVAGWQAARQRDRISARRMTLTRDRRLGTAAWSRGRRRGGTCSAHRTRTCTSIGWVARRARRRSSACFAAPARA